VSPFSFDIVRAYSALLRMNSFLPFQLCIKTAYTSAHKRAQWFFQEQLGDANADLSEAGKIVLQESNKQIELAQKDLNEKIDVEVVKKAVSHKFCKILLTRGVHYIDKLTTHGLLKDSEAEEIVEELDEHLEHVLTCNELHHEGEIRLHLDEDDDNVCTLLSTTKEKAPEEEVDKDDDRTPGFHDDPIEEEELAIDVS
jgi:hypothetical protein